MGSHACSCFNRARVLTPSHAGLQRNFEVTTHHGLHWTQPSGVAQIWSSIYIYIYIYIFFFFLAFLASEHLAQNGNFIWLLDNPFQSLSYWANNNLIW